MRVLFVPLPEGGAAHLIPLLALNKKLEGRPVRTAFLAPSIMHGALRILGVDVLDIDNQMFLKNGFRTEMRAYREFKPDVVVDDANPGTRLATELSKIPRVAIQRTGMFPGGVPRKKNHRHSMALSELPMPDVSFLGLERLRDFTDFFKADFKIVPGIRSIELLPPALCDDSSYFFAGPLLLEDFLMSQLNPSELGKAKKEHGDSSFKSFDRLEEFLEANSTRRIVYITFGTHAQASTSIFNSIRFTIDGGAAVVSSIKVDNLSPSQERFYFYAKYLPMHLVCSKADLVIHQCGSGTYHYPIIHNVPAITIGTGCYDREDVAMRLEELGASVHLPGPQENESFEKDLRETLEASFDGSRNLRAEKKEKLKSLSEEIQRTAGSFDFAGLLYKAVNSRTAVA